MNVELLANNIADESVIEYTKYDVLTPEEASALNQIIYRKAIETLSSLTNNLEEVTA
jgi:hypothetical protein